jgi:hypothetical protein
MEERAPKRYERSESAWARFAEEGKSYRRTIYALYILILNLVQTHIEDKYASSVCPIITNAEQVVISFNNLMNQSTNIEEHTIDFTDLMANPPFASSSSFYVENNIKPPITCKYSRDSMLQCRVNNCKYSQELGCMASKLIQALSDQVKTDLQIEANVSFPIKTLLSSRYLFVE